MNPTVSTGLVIGGAVAAIGGLIVASQCYYTVSQTDVAFVKWFSKVENTTPIGSGLHFKVPFAETVDTLPITQRTLEIPEFSVNTIDNQQVTIDVSLTVQTPESDAYHLLYEVGNAGGGDIEANIIPVVKSLVSDIFAQQNTVNISANRETIKAQIEKQLTDSVGKMFGVEVKSVNLAQVGLSPSFVESNEEAVKAKNEALAATYQAQKRVTSAEADANVQAAQADGQARSTVALAQGNEKAAELNAQAAAIAGKGEHDKQAAIISAFGSVDKYNDYLRAKAAGNWDGKLPTVQGGNGGVNTIIPLPPSALPSTTASTSPSP